MPERFCRACGAELAGGLKFCEKCGTATQPAETQPAVTTATAAMPVTAQPAAAPPAAEARPTSALNTVKGMDAAAPTQPVRGVVDDGDALGRPVKKRSHAWIYWAVVAIVCAVVGVTSTPWLLLVAIGAAAYSFYIFRGGRWVFWISP